MRERGGDYREFGAQCYGTLGEACAANLAEAAVGLASASECSSPSPSPTDPQTPIFFYKKNRVFGGIGKNERDPQKQSLQNILFLAKSIEDQILLKQSIHRRAIVRFWCYAYRNLTNNTPRPPSSFFLPFHAYSTNCTFWIIF